MKYLYIAVALNILMACGSDKPEEVEAPPPAVGGPPPAPGEKLSYQKMQGYLNQYCKDCHSSAKFIQSEEGLKSSSAKTRLANGSMPPASAPKKLPDNIRTEMLSYF